MKAGDINYDKESIYNRKLAVFRAEPELFGPYFYRPSRKQFTND
jgi:hypothetical protein